MGGSASAEVKPGTLDWSPLEIMVSICEDRRDSCQVPENIKTKKLIKYCQKVWPRMMKKADQSTRWPSTGSFDPAKLSIIRGMIGNNAKMRPYIKL